MHNNTVHINMQELTCVIESPNKITLGQTIVLNLDMMKVQGEPGCTVGQTSGCGRNFTIDIM